MSHNLSYTREKYYELQYLNFSYLCLYRFNSQSITARVLEIEKHNNLTNKNFLQSKTVYKLINIILKPFSE